MYNKEGKDDYLFLESVSLFFLTITNELIAQMLIKGLHFFVYKLQNNIYYVYKEGKDDYLFLESVSLFFNNN